MTGVAYFRATHSEVNKILQKTKITDCFAFHIDQTTIVGEVSGTYVYKVVPTQILFIYKNSKLDDKLTDIDTLVNQAEIKADEFHDLLIRNPVIDNSPEWENYELQRLEAYKRYDTIVSGVLFTWNAPIPRSKFYCS